MKINWKVRFRNKAFILALLGAIVTGVYQVLGVLQVVPPISQDSIIQTAGIVLSILATMGVIVDPTTKGITDSDRAMKY